MAADAAYPQRLMPLDPDVDFDEYVDLEPSQDDYALADDEDGGATVTLLGTEEEPTSDEQGGFYRNLAETIPEMVLQRIATDLIQKIENDKEARKKRDEQYEMGIKRTGLGDDAPGGAQFEGASRVVHPGLMEACIDGESRLIKELWPPSGPVKPKILGEVTKRKDEKAKRKTTYMNYQLTKLIKEARSVVETTLTQVMLGGSQFIRQDWDHRLGRAAWQFCPVDKIYMPPNAESWSSANRRTFEDTISHVEYRQRVDSGQYRDLKLAPAPTTPDLTKAQEANQKVEGVAPSALNVDGDRGIYETMAVLEVTPEMAAELDYEEEGKLYPYLLTIDLTSRRVLAFYRDWEEEDQTREPIEHVFEFPMIPWRGALTIGFIHAIGGLSGGATGSLRALLDSAHIANMQGGYLLKGSGASGQNRQAQPGEMVEIDAGLETNDIRQKIMPFTTKEPSGTLFQLLGFLVDAAKGVVRTTLDESPIDTNANVPVGTQLSRVEEGLVVFSSIHGRIHAAFNRLLSGLHRLNRIYLDDVVRMDIEGREIMVLRKDFDGEPDVQPVSDPTIYSDQQRLGQMTAIQQRSAAMPGLYNMREVEKRTLTLLKVPDIDTLLVPAPEPHELNAVNENVAMAMGRPVVVFPDQDHLAHLQAHLDFGQSPVLGGNPILAPKFLPGFVQHVAEHMVYFYASAMNDLVSGAAGQQASKLFDKDPEVKVAFDKLLALASQRVAPQMAQTFEKVMPVLQKAVQALQAITPPPPIDPGQAALKAATAETGRRAAADQAKAQTDGAKLEIEGRKVAVQEHKAASDGALREAAIEADRENTDAGNANDLAVTILETDTAKEIARERIEAGKAPLVTDGQSLSRK